MRFDAKQREPIAAAQHTNDVGQGSDDAVWVDLWPNGISGYFYQFYSTPNGTHYEYSSENTAYSPNWESQGVAHAGGYTVTMRIPFEVIRNAHGGTWKAQFVRYVRATGEQQVWSFDRVQMQPDGYGNSDYAHAGTITMPQINGWLLASEAARGDLRARRGGEQDDRRLDLTRRRRSLGADHADGLVLLDLSPGLLERRARSADDLADGLPALLQRGAALLYAGGELLQSVQLQRVSEHSVALHAGDSDALAKATPSKGSRARSALRPSTRSATVATILRAR